MHPAGGARRANAFLAGSVAVTGNQASGPVGSSVADPPARAGVLDGDGAIAAAGGSESGAVAVSRWRACLGCAEWANWRAPMRAARRTTERACLSPRFAVASPQMLRSRGPDLIYQVLCWVGVGSRMIEAWPLRLPCYQAVRGIGGVRGGGRDCRLRLRAWPSVSPACSGHCTVGPRTGFLPVRSGPFRWPCPLF